MGPADSQTARSLGGTAAFAVLAVGLLLYDHLERNVPALIFWLSMALIVAILAWMIQRSQALAAAEAAAEGSIDPVTGLESRAGLERELEAALSPPASHRALLVFELDGLRAYNAHFGHAAGEEVLRRTARSLAEWAAPLGGTAYRIEDCRLAVLCDLEDGEAGPVALAAEAALHAREGEIPLGWHHGEVALPAEAGDPETAIQLAEKNLDAQGDRQHRSARRQAHSVLVEVLAARRPDLREHLRAVAYRAISIARRVGVPEEELDDVALAAELQDIGLIAVPETVLEKPDALTAEERELIDAHPLAGERIIAAAPDLASVARLVRSSSERFGGGGHPDGLAGEAIPIGSRVIAVAVAYASLTAPRPYRGAAASHEDALAEMRRCAGSQFDPAVVEALASDLEEELAEPAPAPA